jgi:acetoin utilization deacetylase AcuC-like enzyme
MPTFLFTHPACILHDNGHGHPESPARLKAILAELDRSDYKNLERREAPQANMDALTRVHTPEYVDRILRLVPKSGYAPLDHETSLSPHSGEAALRAAGAVIAAVDAVMLTPHSNAFCAVRPPGHHAAVPPASGFCLFNNIAIGAAHALAAHGVKRIAIVDFDVHHGNGTQAWAEGHENVLFISSHQFPLWPGSGSRQERGPLKNIINIPLPPGATGTPFRDAIQSEALPAIEAFAPELIMISAGFDAQKDDPLGGLQFDEGDFGWMTETLTEQAQLSCHGRIVSTLEGGYDVEALADSVGAHVRALIKGATPLPTTVWTEDGSV